MKNKPTVTELENILSESNKPIDVLPSGEVRVFSVSHEFKKGLEELINRYSIENASDTPDFILAEYLIRCLESFNMAVTKRTDWYK